MKKVNGHFGEVRIQDCMEGMKELKDKSFEFFLTDPPYNLSFTGSQRDGKMKDCKIFYEDNMNEDDYFNWCWDWFELLKSKSKMGLLTPGYRNFKKWIIQYPDSELAVWRNITAQGGCKIASFRKWEPILCFNIENERKQHKRLKFAILDVPSCINQTNYALYCHPCPKPYDLWERIILELKPESVLDPFMGSGTTAEVCESLGIPYLGFEIMEDYIPDIEKRIDDGILNYKNKRKEKKQAILF